MGNDPFHPGPIPPTSNFERPILGTGPGQNSLGGKNLTLRGKQTKIEKG
jgi:hypothetical protein